MQYLGVEGGHGVNSFQCLWHLIELMNVLTSFDMHFFVSAITGQYGATFAHKISPWSMVMYGIGIIFG